MTYPSLRLGSLLGEQVLLVRATDALRLCREEGCEALSARRASGLLDGFDRRRGGDARGFASRALGTRLTDVDDGQLLALLRNLVKTQQLVAIREGAGDQGTTSDSTAEQRRLVRALESLNGGRRLREAGREYRLVADVDLGRLPDRDRYEVVRRADAEQVLSSLANGSGAAGSSLATLLGQARGLLTNDWRPPLFPAGLVLLRKSPEIHASVRSPEAAITPSQMKKLVSDWIEIEVVDEDGVPYTRDFSLQLPDTTSINGTFDKEGFYGKHEIDSGKCKLFIPGMQAKADEFSVTVVDEIGKPVANVDLVFGNGQANLPATTDGSGVAKRRVPNAKSVRVTLASPADLAATMQSIWASPRKVGRKDWVKADATTQTVSLCGGQVVKAIAVADDEADAALPEVGIEPFAGLDVAAGSPAKLSVQPLVILATLLGEHFDTDKCFILPQALDDVSELVRLHQQYGETDLLIVGHTDTSGEDSYNLDLSLERASAMRAYLTNDANSWLAWYGSGKPASKRWGETEDTLMIGAVLDGSPYPATVLGYQQCHNAQTPPADGFEVLDEDGEIGPKTRKQLVLDYMHRENTTVPDGTTIEVHGGGELFPLDASGEALDADAEDGQDEAEDRRGEVYLFPKESGIAPPVPGDKASKDEEEYREWRRRSAEADLADLDRPGNCIVSVFLLSNSGNVVLGNRPYQLRIENGPVLEGKTDSEGFLEHTGLPPGDHTLVVDGCESRVGATPPGYTRLPHMMAGYILIEGDDDLGFTEADDAAVDGDTDDDVPDDAGGDA